MISVFLSFYYVVEGHITVREITTTIKLNDASIKM